jgi:hypothetical protein
LCGRDPCEQHGGHEQLFSERERREPPLTKNLRAASCRHRNRDVEKNRTPRAPETQPSDGENVSAVKRRQRHANATKQRRAHTTRCRRQAVKHKVAGGMSSNTPRRERTHHAPHRPKQPKNATKARNSRAPRTQKCVAGRLLRAKICCVKDGGGSGGGGGCDGRGGVVAPPRWSSQKRPPASR